MKTIALTISLLALTCSEKAEPDPGRTGTSTGTTDRGTATPDSSGSGSSTPSDGGSCELVCHSYGGGIEECACLDDEKPDQGVSQQVPDPYADPADGGH